MESQAPGMLVMVEFMAGTSNENSSGLFYLEFVTYKTHFKCKMYLLYTRHYNLMSLDTVTLVV